MRPPAARGYRREVSSVTMSAADCGCRASATLCPAHIDSASMSPVVPAIGGAGSYRRIDSPEAKCAITSPTPRRCASGGRPAACHASADELRSARWGESDHPTERSEEHTSELQSRGHLVCRLLLEKKKKNKIQSKLR